MGDEETIQVCGVKTAPTKKVGREGGMQNNFLEKAK